MNTALPSPTDADGFKMRLIAAWTAGCVVVWLLAPLAAPVLLALCVMPPLLWYWTTGRRMPLKKPSPVILALALAGVYLLINSTWSLSPLWAYRSAGLFFAITAILYFLLNSLHDIQGTVLRAMAVGLLAGLIVGSVFLCFEAFSGQEQRWLLMSYLSGLRPEPHHMVMEGDRIVGLNGYLLNRSISVLTLLFWPGLLIVDRLDLPRRRKALLLIAFGLGAAAILRSEHGTSKMAFAGAAAIFVLCRLYPLVAERLAIAGWVTATLFVVPMAWLAYSGQYYRASWLPPSAQHRIVIWGHTSDQVAKAPFLGSGISTARALNDPHNLAVPRAPGTNFPLSTALHSHNGYLQIWYEAGAVGALLLLGLGLLILRALTRAPSDVQPYLYAVFVACALLAGSSFSIWAPWFMASLAMACVYAALGAALPGFQHDHEAQAGSVTQR